MEKQFHNIYQGKKVLITGNTGFKGSWLTAWLLKLGAKIVGISKDIPTSPSMFESLELESKIDHYWEDIRNLEKIKELIIEHKPDFIFHLAAQPIVKTSYIDPIDTMTSNIIGTANILEALRVGDFKCNAIFITSDKCYDNVEWTWGYRENDALGGRDPYSASKGAAELMIKTYFHSYFSKPDSKVRIISVRAGNVIGGGDWADSRLVPDCFKAWSRNETVEIRSPNATRPWQHVLEPLSGYLLSGKALSLDQNLNGESFNFGPNADQNNSVVELIGEIAIYWQSDLTNKAYEVNQTSTFHEAGLLKLNCDKALHFLNWKPTLDFKNTSKLTSDWYHVFYKEKKNMFETTVKQIEMYAEKAKSLDSEWTR